MRPRALLPLLLTLALPFSLGACGGREPSREVRLLVDGEHAPDVLTERREIANPPALGGNRFLTGWWPWREQGTLVLSPAAQGARMEIVHLGGGRGRTLALDLLQAAPGRKVRVKAAGRDLGAFALTDPVEVPLPDELPVGRVLVELSFEEGSRGVVAAAVRPSLPEGRVRVRGADLVQSGDSLVDLVRPVLSDGGRAETLVGTFVPPARPEPGQRFDLVLEREDGTPIRRFSWSPSLWNRLRGTRDFALRLGEDDRGFVRIRLQARGKGPAGRWKGLGLAGGKSPEPAPPPSPERDRFPQPRLVVVYVMDALRADTVGHLGGPAGISPTLDRLAAEGITFRRHRSIAPNTLPSTKALFTGRTFVSRGGWKLEPEDGPTLAEMFRRAGYRTGLFSGNVYVGPAYKTDRGFEHAAEEVQIDVYRGAEQSPYNDNAARAHRSALAWLRLLRPGEKAFLYIHTIHPHNPYDPPDPFRSRWTRGIPSAIDGSTETLHAIKRGRREATEADRRRLRGLYDGSFAYNDAELAGFLREVAALVPPGETLIAMTADHGEEHFDHGGILHGFNLYEEMLRIPLVLWAPGRLRPDRVDLPTDTLDLHATLIGLCGLQPPKGHSTPGRSLLAVARGEAPELLHLASAASVKGGIYSAIAGRWKVVWAPRVGIGWGQGDGIGRSRDPEYLYDLEKDPREKVNLAGRGNLAAAWLRSRLLAWIERNRVPEDDEPKTSQPLDPETLGRLRALGYAN